MSVEEQKQVETQQTSKEVASTNSVVKTPLVDALRLYFGHIRIDDPNISLIHGMGVK